MKCVYCFKEIKKNDNYVHLVNSFKQIKNYHFKCYGTCIEKCCDKDDEEKIKEFLKIKAQKMKEIWGPFLN